MNSHKISYCLSLTILLEYLLVLPNLNTLISFNIFIKGFIAFLLLFPIGVLLGIFMPVTLDQLKAVLRFKVLVQHFNLLE